MICRRFLKGPNFMPWFQRRRSVAEQEQHRIWRQARSKADVRGFLAKMSEVEIIDAFSAIERHLVNELQVGPLSLKISASEAKHTFVLYLQAAIGNWGWKRKKGAFDSYESFTPKE